MLLKGLPYNPKQSASRIVDLPEPFSPMINVEDSLSSLISVNTFPVERKFFQRTLLNDIITTSYQIVIFIVIPAPPFDIS